MLIDGSVKHLCFRHKGVDYKYPKQSLQSAFAACTLTNVVVSRDPSLALEAYSFVFDYIVCFLIIYSVLQRMRINP
jgi:hypothetical protein